MVVFPLLLIFLLFKDRVCVLALVGPGVNMRYTYVKECRYSWCPKTPLLSYLTSLLDLQPWTEG